MNDKVSSPRARWRLANLIWLAAGFLFPLVSLTTGALSTALLPFLILAGGFSDELLVAGVLGTLAGAFPVVVLASTFGHIGPRG